MPRSRRIPDASRRRLVRARTGGASATLHRAWRDPAVRFAVRCPLLTAIVFAIPVLVPSSTSWLIRATLESLRLATIFAPATVRESGAGFSIGANTIQIVSDCTPMLPILLLVAGILAFPARWRWKAAGMLAGAAVLWVYNLARIYVLMAVLRYAPAQFDVIHVYLWQTVTLLLVVGCFMLWIRGAAVVASPS